MAARSQGVCMHFDKNTAKLQMQSGQQKCRSYCEGQGKEHMEQEQGQIAQARTMTMQAAGVSWVLNCETKDNNIDQA